MSIVPKTNSEFKSPDYQSALLQFKCTKATTQEVFQHLNTNISSITDTNPSVVTLAHAIDKEIAAYPGAGKAPREVYQLKNLLARFDIDSSTKLTEHNTLVEIPKFKKVPAEYEQKLREAYSSALKGKEGSVSFYTYEFTDETHAPAQGATRLNQVVAINLDNNGRIESSVKITGATNSIPYRNFASRQFQNEQKPPIHYLMCDEEFSPLVSSMPAVEASESSAQVSSTPDVNAAGSSDPVTIKDTQFLTVVDLSDSMKGALRVMKAALSRSEETYNLYPGNNNTSHFIGFGTTVGEATPLGNSTEIAEAMKLLKIKGSTAFFIAMRNSLRFLETTDTAQTVDRKISLQMWTDGKDTESDPPAKNKILGMLWKFLTTHENANVTLFGYAEDMAEFEKLKTEYDKGTKEDRTFNAFQTKFGSSRVRFEFVSKPSNPLAIVPLTKEDQMKLTQEARKAREEEIRRALKEEADKIISNAAGAAFITQHRPQHTHHMQPNMYNR